VTDPEFERLCSVAAARFTPAGSYGQRFARGKLVNDPVFAHLLRDGLIPDHARLLDLGCGQGCLLALLVAAGEQYRAGVWPVGWPRPPAGLRLRGIELRAKDVARAKSALREDAEVEFADLRTARLPASDVIVLMDVLHYLEPAAQDSILARIAETLTPQGVLLMRVGDPSARFAAALSWLVDQTVAVARGQGLHRFHRRSMARWLAALESHGLAVSTPQTDGVTPFANMLIVARKQ